MLSFKKFKIDFIIIGVQKGGTSALARYLKKHPSIEMGNIKEIHFFDNESFFADKSKVNYKFYHKHFNNKMNKYLKNKIYGEATPIYFFWKNSLKRIYDYNNKVKLILILRNPIDRAFSQWNMETTRGNEDREFKDCIDDDIENHFLDDRVKSYVSRGFYSKKILELMKLFKKKQLLILKYDDFLEEQEKHLLKIFDFLEVDSKSFKFEHHVVHKINYNERINADDKKKLLKIFLKDIEITEKLLDWDCSNWKTL